MAPNGMTFAHCFETYDHGTPVWRVSSTCPRRDLMGVKPVSNCASLVLLVPNGTPVGTLLGYGERENGEYIPQFIDTEFSQEQRDRIAAARVIFEVAASASSGWTLEREVRARDSYYATVDDCREENRNAIEIA